MLRLSEIISALDEKVTWKEWKYLFKMATSKVVSKWMHEHKIIYSLNFGAISELEQSFN